MKENNLAILLCTYNGNKYISQQLESLLQQTLNTFVIHIHDDGSNDGTLETIDRYAGQYPERIVVHKDDRKHRGAAESFMWMLNKVDAEYYMFCDQDDVWLPNKVELSYKKIRETEQLHPKKPVLIHTDLRIVDEKLNTIHESMWKYSNFLVDVSKKFNYLVFGNVVTGCTVIINKEAREVSLPYRPEFGLMHDYWIALNVARHGIVDNVKEQTILYRQHSHNVVGMWEKFDRRQFSLAGVLKWYRSFTPVLNYLDYGCLAKLIMYRLHYFFLRHF